MKLLSDTCTFLWMATAPDSISTQAKAALVDPQNLVLLSAVSIIEVCIKYSLGQLSLLQPPEDWIPNVRRKLTMDVLSLEEDAALKMASLPRIHRDPFDRMLVCQALSHGLIIVTPDHLIRQYAVDTLW